MQEEEEREWAKKTMMHRWFDERRREREGVMRMARTPNNWLCGFCPLPRVAAVANGDVERQVYHRDWRN